MNIGMYVNKLRLVTYLAMLAGLFSAIMISGVSAAYNTNTATYTLTSTLCGVIGAIAAIIGVVAIFMFILGGIMYAFAHFLPAAGNLKGSMQGWGMGMLMGGIVMLILYLLAPYVVNSIIGASQGTTGIPNITSVNCPR